MRIQRLTLLPIVILLLNTSASHAQDSDMDERKVRFGLYGSPNFGWLTPNIKDFEKKGAMARLGFGYGLMVDYKFSESPNYVLATGLNLTSIGGGLTEPWDSVVSTAGVDVTHLGKLTRTYKLQYVNIPLQLKMRTNNIGYMSYFASVGFDVGIRARAFANNKYEWQNTLDPTTVKDVNIKSIIAPVRFALNLTGGGEFNLSGNTNIYLGVGWHNTFTNIFQKGNRILEPNSNGWPTTDSTTGETVEGKQKKAVANYISLDLGFFF